MAKIFVIAGHGAGDPGAVGCGYSEAERVRVLASRIKALGGDNNVMLGDTSRDYYADNGITTLNIPKDYQIIELHMDAGVASARGGHVIINAGFTPDAYDNALANMIAKILPGRSQMIVQRNNLANPARAAARGYSYRLVEFGFITNATDVGIFNSKMDEIARGVLNAFEIATTTNNNTTIGRKKNMISILKVKGNATHYYFDGQVIHPIGTSTELKVIKELYKNINGVDIYTKEFTTQTELNALKTVLGRTVK